MGHRSSYGHKYRKEARQVLGEQGVKVKSQRAYICRMPQTSPISREEEQDPESQAGLTRPLLVHRLHSLLSMVCDGCPELNECLVNTLQEILVTCITQLQNHTLTTHHGNSSFHVTVKALYGTMQHVLTPALQCFRYNKAQLLPHFLQLYKELQAALACDKLPSDCVLITATDICLVMCYISQNDLKRDFIHTLAISNHLATIKTSNKDSLKEVIEKLMENKVSADDFSHISPSYQVALLFHGLFNSDSDWIYLINKDSYDGLFLYEVYPLIRKLCDGATSYCFQAFQVLLMWLRTVRKFGSKMKKLEDQLQDYQTHLVNPSKDLIFTFSCDHHNSVFHLLSSNWENPSKGVSELVSDCMIELLNLHEDDEPGSSRVQASAMLDSLVSSAAWTSKATYPPLALAISHFGVLQALSAHANLPESLTLGLSVNHLAPPCTSVYKVIVTHLTQHQWLQYFLTPLIKALHCNDRLTRQYALTLWLPPTIRQYPSIFPELIEYCSNTTSGWMARMTILRIARTNGLLELDNEKRVQEGKLGVETRRDNEVEYRREFNKIYASQDTAHSSSIMAYVWAALRHIDDKIRVEALSFLCITRKAAHPLSSQEAEFLKTFFGWNANVDSASFRQSILKAYRVLIVRIRDASAAELKKINTSRKSANALQYSDISPVLKVNIGMLLWFINFCHKNLSLDGNYQRKILALQLYKETLLAFCTRSQSTKYIVSPRYKTLCNFINTSYIMCVGDFIEDNWQVTDFTLPWTLEALLYSCLDDMNDVRKEAEDILKILGSFSKNLCLEESKAWMKHGMALTSSPKASDVEGGAAVILSLSPLCHSEGYDIAALVEASDGEYSYKDLATLLLSHVKQQFIGAQNNLLQAAKNAPIHGSLLALGRYLTEQDWDNNINVTDVQSFLQDVFDTLIQLVEFMLSKLACASPNGSAIAPSFAEMGRSVEMIVRECCGDDDSSTNKSDFQCVLDSCQLEVDEEGNADGDECLDNSIPADHLLVLSCCWQTLKICSMVSGWCVEKLLQYLDVNIVRKLTKGVVVRTLMATRHKGAMEAARAAYTHICHTLLTVEGNYEQLVFEQVEELVECLRFNQGTSVTRRGAGMAMMVQAACGASPKHTTRLLSSTISSLLTIAQVKVEANVNVDAAPVLALHLLQSIVLHAPLAPHLPPYLPTITATCFSAFTSDSWALRNAALQLYGGVMPRMMGQKKVRDDSSAANSVTASEFIARHPPLSHLILVILRGNNVETDEHKDCDVSGCCNSEIKEGEISGVEELVKGYSEYEKNEIGTEKRKDCTYMKSIDNQENYSSNEKVQDINETKWKKVPVSEMSMIKVSSSLVPALSLVARLSPGTKIQHSKNVIKTLSEFCGVISRLLGSPIHAVRRLSAVAMVALTPVDEIVSCITSSIVRFSSLESVSANLIHGNLLMICNFLKTYPNLTQNIEVKNAISSLHWLLEPDVKCYIIANLAINIFTLMLIDVNIDYSFIDLSLPGAFQYRQTLLKIKMQSKNNDMIEQMILTDTQVLSDHLDQIVNHIGNGNSSESSHLWILKVEHLLWKKLEDPICYKTVYATLTLLNTILKKNDKIDEVPSDICLKNLLLILQGSKGVRATSLALITVAYLLKNLCIGQCNEKTLDNFTTTFINIMKRYSAPTSTEDYRLAASTGLQISMKVMLNSWYVNESCKEQLIVSCTQLLQDEDSEVRDSACYIVSSFLSNTEKYTVHCNLTVLHSTPYSLFVFHSSLSLYEFTVNLAVSCVACNDWSTFRTLWRICSGQLGEKYFLSDDALLTTRSYLFKSHTMNLYKEPKETSLIISTSLLKALWEEKNVKKKCYDENVKHTPDWLHEEEEILNQYGKMLVSLINKQQELYKHKELITAVFVYSCACRTFTSLCNFFNKSVNITYPLNWKKDRFCIIETATTNNSKYGPAFMKTTEDFS